MEKSNRESAGLQQRKQALLPQITKLGEEGLSGREIAGRLNICKSTVNEWRREMRAKAARKKALDRAEVIREAIGQEEAICEEFMRGLRRSQLAKQSELSEESGPAADATAWKKKRSVRSESHPGNAAFLSKAMDAQRAIRDLKLRLADMEGYRGCAPSGSSA